MEIKGVNLVSGVGVSGRGVSFQPRSGLRPPPIPPDYAMRFYDHSHRFYCGVDLHARTMYLVILDHGGQVVFDHNLAASPGEALRQLAGRVPTAV
jgi:hypothetical protein